MEKVQFALIERIIDSFPELLQHKDTILKFTRKTNFKKALDEYPFVTEYKKLEFENEKKYYYNTFGCTLNSKGEFVGFVVFDKAANVKDIILLENYEECNKINNDLKKLIDQKYEINCNIEKKKKKKK